MITEKSTKPFYLCRKSVEVSSLWLLMTRGNLKSHLMTVVGFCEWPTKIASSVPHLYMASAKTDFITVAYSYHSALSSFKRNIVM